MAIIKLYHIALEKIENPDIKYGRKNADFGQGFYLSDNKEFSLKWAPFDKEKDTFLNIYELDLKNLKIKNLYKDDEWFDYIYNNRNFYPDFLSEYDVISGPIANDTIYNTLGIITSGLLDKDKASKLLMLGDNYQQIVIKTSKAKENLKYIGSEKIDKEDVLNLKKKLKKEEKKYQKLIYKSMKKF